MRGPPAPSGASDSGSEAPQDPRKQKGPKRRARLAGGSRQPCPSPRPLAAPDSGGRREHPAGGGRPSQGSAISPPAPLPVLSACRRGRGSSSESCGTAAERGGGGAGLTGPPSPPSFPPPSALPGAPPPPTRPGRAPRRDARLTLRRSRAGSAGRPPAEEEEEEKEEERGKGRRPRGGRHPRRGVGPSPRGCPGAAGTKAAGHST
ncbi:collagen alpha-1(III) chain-like [Colius striatus]|uniref:collagen alpha-1(III) chain-like n=1 Tax=Colius striatus TaxID=57412 RepID=UPI002B1D8337|nr:collagen alpha-1(III) chain-like [Colius striatus]